MYNNFFGFKEKPFRLVPNPAYLYLSRSHKEAMDNLTYALTHGEGFVEITGEVGTGKTTLCRAFLDSLGEKTEFAYIFNPKLDSFQLIKAINDEFGLRSDGLNIKELIDRLNYFLLEKKREGKNVILIIDEAQNLTTELLEQLRLLSNLETNTSKLIQIILIGQPELREKLESHELRQLNQRITLSCRLRPLTLNETREYIEHRLHIASTKPGIKFTGMAFRFIHDYSKGYPRLINIACDRALLAAYGADRHQISGFIAREAIMELKGKEGFKSFPLVKSQKGLLLGALLTLLSIPAFILGPRIFNSSPDRPDEKDKNRPAATQEAPMGQVPALSGNAGDEYLKTGARDTAQGQGLTSSMAFGKALQDMRPRASRNMALAASMNLWGATAERDASIETMKEDQAYFKQAAELSGFELREIEGDFTLLQQMNLPAILKLKAPEKASPRYLTIYNMDRDKLSLTNGKREIHMKREDFRIFWNGEIFMPWKNYHNINGTIPFNAPESSMLALKILLHDIGYKEIPLTPVYDELTRNAILILQKRYGIEPDGIVGSTTKIILYNEKESLAKPRINN